ncbi:uncharacterized protein C2845_PM03G02410 [Panicum miliaceum]|uniref:Nucleotide-diphospho-sugar transferase domain-containing protein n=1 Tax=Panicum miliaceum TaxID=4540 RepID=A0A3L6T3I8_PANMI|nr:uncharacterized protein C2845_PM03G02410 [Panicum miliaceum]
MNTVRNLLRFLLLAATTTVAWVVLLLHRSPCPCGHRGQWDPSSSQHGAEDKQDGELAAVLRRAAMEDNTIIMTFTNEAFAAPGSLMDLFLESFRLAAFGRCRQVHPHCYALATGGANFTGEQRFMARDYLDMMWRRNRFQARVLAPGYSFVFADVDMVWFRNPLLRVPVATDLAMPCDNPYDLDKRANGGLCTPGPAPGPSRSTARAWYGARGAHPGKNEQDLFDKLKRELSAAHGVAAQFVDTDYLGGFCERRKRRDFNKLCTYHGNCLVGLRTKLERLRGVLDEWKEFKAKAGKPGSNVTALTD